MAANGPAGAAAASAEAVIAVRDEEIADLRARLERAEKAVPEMPGGWFIVSRDDLRTVLQNYQAATASAEARGAAERLARVAYPMQYLQAPGPCEPAEHAEAEIARLQSGARTLGATLTSMARAMEAARIEMAQRGPDAAMQWILESLPDVSDAPAGQEWDGTETAREWLERTAGPAGEAVASGA